MNRKKFLVVSPHPDDAELAIGGIIIRLRQQNHQVFLVDLTSGEPTPHGSGEKRKLETEAASRVLDVRKRINLDLPNRYLFDTRESRMLLAEQIRLFRPDALLCPAPQDSHPDHIATSSITLGARFYSKYHTDEMKGEPFYPPVLLQFFCTHLRISPEFSFLIDISAQFDQKIEAVKCYQSQFVDNKKNLFVFDIIRNRAAYYGSLIGTDYAEPLLSTEALRGDLLLNLNPDS